jgi:hypothetical protein
MSVLARNAMHFRTAANHKNINDLHVVCTASYLHFKGKVVERDVESEHWLTARGLGGRLIGVIQN